MKISKLRKAIEIVRTEPVLLTPQAATYLRTYPVILKAAEQSPREPLALLCQLATMAYGWMPRVARIDREHLKPATAALKKAMRVSAPHEDIAIIRNVAACLHSVVGASKLLHFLMPDDFPIWDSKVARVWSNQNLKTGAMTDPKNYVKYAREVHKLSKRSEFPSFKSDFEDAYAARLKRLGIPHYGLTDVRTIEAAAFELAGGEYEDA